MNKACLILSTIAAVWLSLIAAAAAQSFGGAFEGMTESDEPIQIEADKLEVLDDQKLANFLGNVKVVQGTTVLKAGKLKVFYLANNSGSGNNGNIKRIEASGKVAVRSKDQHATANSMIFNVQSRTIELRGDVALSQGNNIVTGCTVLVNLNNNKTEFKDCRPKIMFEPQSQQTN